MRPHRVTRSTKIDIILLDERRVGQVRALLTSSPKLFRAFMGWNEFLRMQQRQATWFLERQRPQQKCVHNAEDSRVGANADGKCGNCQCRMPRAASPQSQRIPDILRHFARAVAELTRPDGYEREFASTDSKQNGYGKFCLPKRKSALRVRT